MSKSYDTQLQQHAALLSEMESFLLPEMVRRQLDKEGYERNTRSENKRIRERTSEVVGKKDVRTFAAICSHVGADLSA